MILKADSIELILDNKSILKNIYIDLSIGKITCLLGRNGSGKSSLFNVIFGITKPRHKHIKFEDKIIQKALYKTKSITYLPQRFLVPNHLTPINAFKLYNLQWENFTNHFPELDRFKSTKFKKLSGGERRLIEIYLCLKKESKIVILDEPFAYLSPIYIDKITPFILEEKKHKGILISDHNFRPLLKISDCVYFINHGSIKKITSNDALEELNYFI